MAEQLQKLNTEFTQLQTELAGIVTARERLESQQQENQAVKKEFDTLDDDANIYKLVGPVLLKQETSEAVHAVEARLGFIEKEIERVEKQIKELEEKCEKKKVELLQCQTQLQQQQQQQQQAASASA
ncbi:Prefoldin [Ascosphaera apis ARSEF 7405]|uniref:Prefoldin n=1 Tax=Ascosphaera apis ARSEF 7405 TaxID=392613 RepID=A0A168BTU6_9EURO|nr:Prefoldin [Ascosphaera apis ARSEF 7405]